MKAALRLGARPRAGLFVSMIYGDRCQNTDSQGTFGRAIGFTGIDQERKFAWRCVLAGPGGLANSGLVTGPAFGTLVVHREQEDQGRKDEQGAGDGTTRNAATASSSDVGKSHLIGDALRSVYRRTLEEEIPDDFLDLLNKLK